MKTVIVGGGRACLAILEFLDARPLRELEMEVACVVDTRVDAPGLVFANEQGIHTLTDYRAALSLPDVELVLELTGDGQVLADLYRAIDRGVRVIDHVSARLFWDLMSLEHSLRRELKTRAALEKERAVDRERSRYILDSLPGIVMVLDRDKNILQANARFSEVCGVPLARAVGHSCPEFLCPARREGGPGCTFDDAVQQGKPVSAIVEREDLEHSFWEVTACPQYDEAGNLIEVVETHHPVTERMLLRREVEIAEKRFRQFIDSANDVISIKDTEGRYVVVNPATAALFEMEPPQLIGRTPAELYDVEVAEIISAHDNEVIEKRRYANYTERFVIDGRERYLDVTRFPLLDYEGNVDGVCTIARDATQRFFPLIFDSISHAIFTVDSEGTITSFNRAAEQVTGYRREEVIGTACSAILQSSRCEDNCPLKASMNTGETAHDQDATIVTKLGKSVPISLSTAALIEDGNRIVGGVEMFRDLRQVTELRKELEKTYVLEDIVSKSHHMKRLLETLPLIADSQSTVLIEGESGTGKELVARAIHNLGPRRNGPFVAINCAAVPDSLIESELFGYKKGAFTDAKQDKPGRFALAEGGTLLLDEIGDLSKQMQVKLLRVLQEKEYEPLGSTETVRADVRVVASTNRNLAEDVHSKKFRQDLYYRLNVVRLEVPPLQTRKEDIPILVNHFIDHFNALQGRRITGCSERVRSALMRYPFPGNIRELENAIEHAFVVCIDTTIQMDDLPQHILNHLASEEQKAPAAKPPLEDAEMHAIVASLERNDYNRTRTAADLGVSRNTLWRKMKRYGISAASS
jgi:PAS domain S-box-containing protein